MRLRKLNLKILDSTKKLAAVWVFFFGEGPFLFLFCQFKLDLPLGGEFVFLKARPRQDAVLLAQPTGCRADGQSMEAVFQKNKLSSQWKISQSNQNQRARKEKVLLRKKRGIFLIVRRLKRPALKAPPISIHLPISNDIFFAIKESAKPY